jgi:hypothetical protein
MIDPRAKQFSLADLQAMTPSLEGNYLRQMFKRGLIQGQEMELGSGRRRLYSLVDACQIVLLHGLMQLHLPAERAAMLANRWRGYFEKRAMIQTGETGEPTSFVEVARKELELEGRRYLVIAWTVGDTEPRITEASDRAINAGEREDLFSTGFLTYVAVDGVFERVHAALEKSL